MRRSLDRLALRQDGDHHARLRESWDITKVAYCDICTWPVRLVMTAINRLDAVDDVPTFVYVPRHGDPYGRDVTYPEARWTTEVTTSSSKRHVEACPIAARSKNTKLHLEHLEAVFRLPVCKSCVDLLESNAEQDEDND